MFKHEWHKLLQNYGLILVLVMIALIPAIYCWLYLSSMWDTYGKLDDIPVAVVNHDQLQHYRGKTIRIGHNLVQALKKSDSLAYHAVSAARAKRGLDDGHYYMIVTIPKSFSKDATTLLSAQPKKLQLHYRLNSGRNFIVSKMTNGAATAIQSKVAAQVTKMYAGVLLTTVQKVGTGLTTAGQGSTRLAAGATQLQAGASKLTQGSAQLSTGLKTLQTAVPNSPSTQPLQQGLSRLAVGNQQLTHGLQAESQGLTAIQSGSQQSAQQLTASAQKLATIHHQAINADALANPVAAVKTDEATVPNNGTGMAPFAIAIGLFVGGIAVGTMFDAYTPSERPRHWFPWWSAKFSVVGIVGVLQASGLYLVLRQVIGLTTQSNAQLYGLLVVGALTFLALIFALRILLGGFGTWLVTIVLVLQLSASAGLYPVQLTSSFASQLNPYLPMTYLIDGLRHAISLGGSIQFDVVIMGGVMVLACGLVAVKFMINVHTDKFGFLDGQDLEATTHE
ncbi:YhgE/Pip family protein [Lactiplantibacillus fabifermentans]|nr:YhgE/Pip family protein [Lactiplantibacillus fabifermentans]